MIHAFSLLNTNKEKTGGRMEATMDRR